MIRRPRQTEPDKLSMRLAKTLEPLTVVPWGALAMWYLGVPIAVGAPMVVVQDDDYADAIERLETAGFSPSVPKRDPPHEIMQDHPDPQYVLEEVNAGYKRLDGSCTVFDYPQGDPAGKGLQVYVIPNSFAHVFQEDKDTPRSSTRIGATAPTTRFQSYGSLYYPLKQALVESFVKAAIDEETHAGVSAWGESLRSWVSLMTGYLEVDNDVLDLCPDKQAVYGRLLEQNCNNKNFR